MRMRQVLPRVLVVLSLLGSGAISIVLLSSIASFGLNVLLAQGPMAVLIVSTMIALPFVCAGYTQIGKPSAKKELTASLIVLATVGAYVLLVLGRFGPLD